MQPASDESYPGRFAPSCSLPGLSAPDDPRDGVLDRWQPGIRVGGQLLPRPNVLDRVVEVRAEPDERDSPAFGEPDLAPELVGPGGDLTRNAAFPQPARHGYRPVPGLLRVNGHQHRRRHTAGGGQDALAYQRCEYPGDAEGVPDPGEGRSPVTRQGVVAAPRGHGPEFLRAEQQGLVDGARVVIETPRNPEVRHHSARFGSARDPGERGEIRQAFIKQLVGDAQSLHLVDEGLVLGTDPRQGDTGAGLGFAQPHLFGQHLDHHIWPNLVVLVDALENGCGVLDPEAPVEPLREFPVVDPNAHRRQSQVPVQLPENVEGHQGDLGVVVIGQPVASDDVDVGLGELPVASLLRALTAPDLLHLVAAEGEVQVPGVFQHVAGEGYRQVEVEAEFVRLPLLCVQAPDDVDFLVYLPLAGQLVEGFDGPGLDGRETVEFEGGGDGGEHLVLHQAPGGKELGETGDRFGTYHGSALQEIGLQVGVVDFLGPDGGGFPVAGQQHGLVGKGLDDSPQGGSHLLRVPAGQVGSPDGAPKEHVPGQQHLPGFVPDLQERGSAGVSRGGVGPDFEPAGEPEGLVVPEVPGGIQFILADELPDQRHQPGSQARGRPGEHFLIGLRAPDGNVPHGRQSGGVAGVVEVSVSAQDGLRTPAETAQSRGYQFGSLHTRIDHEAPAVCRVGGDEIAVGGPWGNWDGLDTHPPTVWQ